MTVGFLYATFAVHRATEPTRLRACIVDFHCCDLRNVAMRIVLTFCVLLSLCACASNAERIEEIARSAGLTRTALDTNGHRMLVYMKRSGSATERLFVFLEGDGIPWRDGIVPNTDPTTRHPLALQFLIRMPHTGAYVVRPCYQRITSSRCAPELWTNARYAEEVVDAMAATVREARRLANAREIVLVGHSGGGTLAILIAERLDGVAAVVTIAANLDIATWARHHGYLPLERSLNPATSERDHPWREIHLIGGKDTVVPPATTAAYFTRYPSAQRWLFAEHGHVCCWLREWDRLWKRIEEELER